MLVKDTLEEETETLKMEREGVGWLKLGLHFCVFAVCMKHCQCFVFVYMREFVVPRRNRGW